MLWQIWTATEEEYISAAEKFFEGYQKSITCLGWQDVQELDDDVDRTEALLETSWNKYIDSE